MAGPFDWSIKIVPADGGKGFAFQPDVVPPVAPNATLFAQAADIVSWGNETDTAHTLTMSTGQTVTCPANGSSTPQYVVLGKPNDTISYRSSVDPAIVGTITLTTF